MLEQPKSSPAPRCDFAIDTMGAGHARGALPALSQWIAQWSGLSRSPEHQANQFASWLPYAAYISGDDLFINRDSSGFVLELMPQSGADERMAEVLLSLYAPLPAGAGVQFNLFGSPHVRDTLRRYANMRMEDADQAVLSAHWGRPARNLNLYRTLARQRVAHLLQGSQTSLLSGFHYCVRDFRLMLSVSVPWDANNAGRREELLSVRDSMVSTLNSASLTNRVCDAADLINWCSLFTNPDRLSCTDLPRLNYDDGREIRDQIVDFDTVQDLYPAGIRFWKAGAASQRLALSSSSSSPSTSPDLGACEMEARFFSIKSFPQRFALWQMGALIGDLMQPALQYSSPFLLTMGVHMLDPNTMRTAVAANNVRATQNADSKMARVMPDVAKKREDWAAVAEAIDAGGRLVSMYHQLALFTHPKDAVRGEQTAKAIWRARGFELNADVYMQRQALLASLPMTLSERFHKDLKKMRRVTRKTLANAVHLAPIVTEWRGTRSPVMVFAGRRGQVITADLYDNPGNMNAAVVGSPGQGKSVLLNEMAWSYRSIGAKVWMMDLGKSFEKLCRNAKGTYIEFTPTSRICLNMFSTVPDERLTEDGRIEGGINEDIDMIKPALAKMCSAHSQLDEVQLRALGVTALQMFKKYGRDLTITGLRDALRSGTLEAEGVEVKNDQRIKDLALMLSPYCKGGEYERFFEGRNNVDMSNDLIVIEGEELKRKPDLQTVVNIIQMHRITGEMYLSRDRRKVFLIDELKQQLGDAAQDDRVLLAAIDEASRRARKYGGALVTATQSGDDYYSSAQMEAALNCADFVFLFKQKSESLELLQKRGRLAMDESKKRLLNSLRTEPGAYSEFFISCSLGEGVARCILDPATHLLFSNKLDDNKPLDALRAQGLTIDEAITALLRQRGELRT